MKRHNLDLTSLVFALVFLVYASLWPLWQLDILDQGDLSWVPASALILIGLLGLTLSIARSRPDRSMGDLATDGPETGNDSRFLFDDTEETVVVDDSR